MFYKMIENKCREWYHSEECTVHSLVEYIEKTGKMRDAQVEAIKLYLFLKIGCGCKPLELWMSARFLMKLYTMTMAFLYFRKAQKNWMKRLFQSRLNG